MVANALGRADAPPSDDVARAQWKSLSKKQQRKYYELADAAKLLHSQQHPDWSCTENYVSRRERNAPPSNQVQILGESTTKAHLTCVCVFQGKKRKRQRVKVHGNAQGRKSWGKKGVMCNLTPSIDRNGHKKCPRTRVSNVT